MKKGFELNQESFVNKEVLITGGNGFIGANLIEKLLELGAKITIFTNSIEDNWKEKNRLSGDIEVILGNIVSAEAVESAVKNKDYVIHLAGLSGAVESNSRPLLDLEVNCKGALNLLEACRKESNKIKGILFASSQLVYGKPQYLPVDELHPTNPTSIYGIHKLAIEKYFLLYHENFGLNTKILRISNPYGPRQSMDHTYGIVNYFIGLALKNGTINIYGKGDQIRDYIFIDDLVDAMILTLTTKESSGKIYNVGGQEKHSLNEMAESIIGTVKRGSIKHIDWPEEAQKLEIGDLFLSKEKIKRDLDWSAQISLPDGVMETIDFYNIK